MYIIDIDKRVVVITTKVDSLSRGEILIAMPKEIHQVARLGCRCAWCEKIRDQNNTMWSEGQEGDHFSPPNKQ